MREIKNLLSRYASEVTIYDASLVWGACASDYRSEIAQLPRRDCPVLIELENDLDLPAAFVKADWKPRAVLLIDHHNDRAGADAPTSIEQIVDLFHLHEKLSPEEQRRLELVSANDRGHICAMRSLDRAGSPDEIAKIRRDDRVAQGVTADDETAAREAIACREELLNSEMTVVRTRSDRTSPVVDFLHPELGGPDFKTLVVETPSSTNVFASGPVIQHLVRYAGDRRHWYGGMLPKSGFWGSNEIPAAEIRRELVGKLSQ